MIKKYIGVVLVFAFSCLDAMDGKTFNTTELKRNDKKSSKKNNKIISRFLQLLTPNTTTAPITIDQVFSPGSGFYGGDCYEFNIAAKLVIDNDCKMCLSELLDMYKKKHVFLTCRSQANGKTIIHHIFDNINKDNYAQLFKDTYRILNFHNVLAKTVDKNGQLPQVPQGKLDVLEVNTLNQLLSKYDEKDIIPASLFSYYLKYKKFKEAQQIVESYDPQQSTFLKDKDLESERNYVHFIVYLMARDSFLSYLDIMSSLLKIYPELADAKDVDGGLPLDCLNEDLEHKDRLTEDQIEVLIHALKKKFSLLSFFKK